MKKKIFVGAILSSFFAIALGSIFSSLNNNDEKFNDVINEEELFDNQFAHVLEPKNALANDELLEPKMGVQLSSVVDNKRSIRFIGVIQDLNVSCSFTRSIYDEETSYNSGASVFNVTTAFSSIKMGNNSYTPEDFGFTGYKYFVTYTLKNIPASHWYHITDVSLEVSGLTSTNETLTKTGENKANVHGAMKSYYESTFTFEKLSDGTYSISVNEDATDEDTYLIPEYVNTYEGNVASKDALITAYADNAFRGCSNITSFTISENINSIGSFAFKGCSNLNEVYYENDLEAWCNITFDDEYANPMAYASTFKLLDDSNTYYELNEIEIPTSITEIGDYQFYNFNKINNVVLHDDIVSFGEKAFYNFSSLETLYYNETIDTFNKLTFGDDYHSDPSNYAQKFYVLNDSSEFEEYEKPELDSDGGASSPSNPSEPTITKINITKYSGHLESFYAEWTPYSDATGYNVYYKLSSSSSWTQVDEELIRSYGSYIRVDAVGLKAGNYNLKIIPIVSNSELEEAAQTCTSEVKAHDRSGYAFVNGSASGAYNDDGTLKSNAVVLYITENTKNTITMDVVTDSKGNKTTSTGLQTILDSYKNGYDSTPLCIRLIGNITDFATLTSGDILIKGSGASKRLSCGITLEGIGNDAVANGWGIRIANASNVEVRNLATMNCNSSEGDNISLQQNNDHIWVHNCDLFYGDAGSDADQAKGDGALDTKTSSYVTHSYNHFWDTGKSNLQGMKSESTENYITYHHNWYDHSDSRHPRIRTCTVHVYNNYYDGIAKYGIGSTMGSSVYVEGNYFRNCAYPMLISLQGSDVSNGNDGTFSGEEGGVIKAYDNYITGEKSFVTYQENNSEFDAYLASSRTETVPSSVKSVSGGNTYSNFDTASSFYDYIYESPSQAKETTMQYAGRVEGGDFKWTFTDADDEDYDVNSELKSALKSYITSLVSVGGNSISGSGGDATVDTSEIIAKIAALDNAVTLENIDEVKSVYKEYLTYDSSLITNRSKIIRLYNEALVLEESHFEDLVYIANNNLTLTNLNNATNYYNSLTSSQKENVATYKAILDDLYVEYESIAVDNVISLIATLPNKDDITLADKTNVDSVLEAYENLSSSQKQEVTNYDKLVELLAKLQALENQEIADEFIAKVNGLPSSTSKLQASDLNTIETLLNDYENFDDEVKTLIDSSYINKLNTYKTYIETYLVVEKTVSITSSDISGTEGTTENGFIYETNGLSDEDVYIKLKDTNHITYNVETSSINLVMTAICTDSSEAKTFTVTITYKDGTSKDFSYTLAKDRVDKTFNETFTGDITSITINGLSGKNLGVLSLSLTYITKGNVQVDEAIVAFEELVSNCSSSLTKDNLDAAYESYNNLNDEQKSVVEAFKIELDSLQGKYNEAMSVYESIENLPNIDSITIEDEGKVNEAKTNYNALSDAQKALVTNVSKISSLEARISELKDAKNNADEFISKVNGLPENTSSLVLDDLVTIEALINEYNSLDSDTKLFIDSSYVNKLNEYKEYINDNLVDNGDEEEQPSEGITIGGVFDDWSKDGVSTPLDELFNLN